MSHILSINQKAQIVDFWICTETQTLQLQSYLREKCQQAVVDKAEQSVAHEAPAVRVRIQVLLHGRIIPGQNKQQKILFCAMIKLFVIDAQFIK